MKTLLFVFLLLVVPTGAVAQQESSFYSKLAGVKGRVALKDDLYQPIWAGKAMLERKMQAQSGEACSLPLATIVLVNDDEVFLKDYSKKFGVKFDAGAKVNFKQSFMSSFGFPAQLPVVIRAQSHEWQRVVALWECEQYELAAAIIASALEHELVFHIALKNSDEAMAHQIELAAFQGYLAQMRPCLSPQLLTKAEAMAFELEQIIAEIKTGRKEIVASR